jgi:hypothetical protein
VGKTGVLENRALLSRVLFDFELSLKISLMAGIKSNMVTAVELDGRWAPDGPGFLPQLNAAAKNFKEPSKNV